MASVDFAQIPFEVICRFGELDKTEIRVLSYLYACRNTESKQCNPGRKLISTDTGIAKTHLSTALSSLESNGWILEDENGQFTLFANPPKREKVTDSVTARPAKKVTDSVTIVTDSVTEVTDSVTVLNKDLEHRKNIEGTENKIHSSETDTSRKPKLSLVKKVKPADELADNPEYKSFRARLWVFQKNYADVPDRERIIANNQALKKLWKVSEGSAEICEQIHVFLQSDWKDRKIPVMWTEVFKNFDFNKKRVNALVSGENNGQYNGHSKSNTEKSGDRVLSNRNLIAQLRSIGENQQRQLRGSGG
jgi:hypothetical protein